MSNGALVDSTPPSFHLSVTRVLDSKERQSHHLNDHQSFTIEWDGIIDHESQMMNYEVGLLWNRRDNKHEAFVRTQTTTRIKIHAGILEAGKYGVRIRARNRAGLVSEANTTTFTIDSSPPMANSGVHHEPTEGEVVGCQLSSSSIAFSWQKCTDEESPVIGYTYLVVEEFQDTTSDPLKWSSVGLATFARASDLVLKYNTTYRVFVRCRNAANLFTEMQSQRIVLTNETPKILSFEHNSEYLSSSTNLIARSTATISYGSIAYAECGFGLSPLLARVDAQHSQWKAHLTNYSANEYTLICDINGIHLHHGQRYFLFIKVNPRCVGH